MVDLKKEIKKLTKESGDFIRSNNALRYPVLMPKNLPLGILITMVSKILFLPFPVVFGNIVHKKAFRRREFIGIVKKDLTGIILLTF